jgi:Asp-tRNA(Asn)/Glu-tRNA(Gln) amidotransferase A subunit family amidase
MTALPDASAHELSSAYRARQVSPVDVTGTALARIEAWDARTRRRRRAPGRSRKNRTQ